jgi:hypothetical protein
MWRGLLSRNFNRMLQSLYTTAVVNQIIEDRQASAIHTRRKPFRRRRIFGRRAAPLSAPVGRLRASGAGR